MFFWYKVYLNSYFGHWLDPHIINTLSCSGSETNFLQFANNKQDAVFCCGDNEVAGALCISILNRLILYYYNYKSFYTVHTLVVKALLQKVALLQSLLVV